MKKAILLIGRGKIFRDYIQGMINIFSREYDVLVIDDVDIQYEDRHIRLNIDSNRNRIIVGEKNGLVVPNSALLHEEDHFIVFVQKGDQFEKRLVEPGVRSGEEVEIVDGLEDGEKVVTSGAYQLKNIAFSSAPAEED